MKHTKRTPSSPTTYDMYYGCLKRYIEPNIGHYKLDSINSVIIQKFINDLAQQSLNKKDGLSQSSIKQVVITLRQAFNQAIDLNIIYQNPCAKIQIPNKPKRKASAFTVDEQERFLSFCSNENTFENLFIFAFNTGMRLGELLAVTWNDVDWENNIININKNITVVNNYDGTDKKSKTIINTTKTESGTRTIPLTKKALQVITAQKEQNHTESPFIFYSAAGTPLMKRNIYRAFQKLLKKAEITSDLTIHSMRHSFATRLLEKGADIKTVSQLLGHKSIQITLDIYSHVSGNLKSKTIALLDD